MKPKICILTQSHLCRNPRVVKEAIALDSAGFRVVILTTFTYPDLLQEDLRLIGHTGITLKGAVNMLPDQSSRWYRLRNRLKRRVAGEVIGRFSWENVYALGYDYRKNLKEAIREQADLYTCHQEISTVIGCKLIRKGYRVAFDFEDWYSHDLLPEANRTRPIRLLAQYEKRALKEGSLCYTTSRVLAEALGNFAGTPPPHVLRNVFPFADRHHIDRMYKDRVNRDIPSIHWYSQTIGPGRGIEFLIDTLQDVHTPLEFHLRGNLFPGFREELLTRFPQGKGHTLFFHSLVPHAQLLSRIAEHDIGMATEEYRPDSRNLTITNKILQYLLAGIAVVATDTKGQTEVAAEAPGAVLLYPNRDRRALADLLNNLLEDPERIRRAKESALQAAQETFCWEREEPMLVKWITGIVNPSGS